MTNNHWITILCFLLAANVSFAQSGMLEKIVTVQYFNVELQYALEEISKVYNINFTYSADRIAVNQKVSADVEDAPLSLALEDLLEETDITYAGIGNQVVLKVDQEKRALLSQRRALEAERRRQKLLETPKPEPIKREDVTVPLQIGRLTKRTEEIHPPVYEIELETVYDPDFYANAAQELEEEGFDFFSQAPGGERVAQVSLFGRVGTNGEYNANTTNKLSANIFWGKNGGVNGTEVGGFVNAVVNDVKGIQVAGFGNVVGGDVHGTQASGLFNVNRGTTNGAQASGLINVSGKTHGVQASGLMNVSSRGSTGIQASGVGNFAGYDSKAGIQASGVFNVNRGNNNIQVAGLFNHGRKKNNIQVAGLFNVARGTTNIQAAGLMNIAHRVMGAQIGLINIADTAGATIGLINIVKKGYNRFEISGAEVLYFNAELKLGSRGFYNIFHFGYRPMTAGDVDGYFAFGYGFGRVFKTKKARVHHNLELLATQIGWNETEQEQNLNLLNQLRWAVDLRVGRSTSLFFGPTVNLIVSKWVNEDQGTYDLDILPYTMFEKVNNNTSAGMITNTTPTYLAGWIGVNAGIRF
ncbi:MAG: STN domain-containing protein [Bacteroidota bacterium]